MRFSVLSFTPFLVSVVWSMLGDLCERETWVLGYGNRVKAVDADDEYKVTNPAWRIKYNAAAMRPMTNSDMAYPD